MVAAIANIAFQVFLGMPLLAWGGLITFLSLLTTAFIGYNVHMGKMKFKYHKLAVIITISLAFIHGTIAFLSFI